MLSLLPFCRYETSHLRAKLAKVVPRPHIFFADSHSGGIIFTHVLFCFLFVFVEDGKKKKEKRKYILLQYLLSVC